MKIGIDLDDVVFEYVRKYLEIYEKEKGHKVNFDDVYSYDFTKVLGVDWEEVSKIVKQMADVNVELDLCPDVHDSIVELAKENEIYFITSRVYKNGTLESLMKYFSEINFELIFSSNPYAKTKGKNKGVICRELGVEFMIEDSYEHAKDCVNEGISVFLIDKPWNRNKESYIGMEKVDGWKEIVKIIRGGKE